MQSLKKWLSMNSLKHPWKKIDALGLDLKSNSCQKNSQTLHSMGEEISAETQKLKRNLFKKLSDERLSFMEKCPSKALKELESMSHSICGR